MSLKFEKTAETSFVTLALNNIACDNLVGKYICN